MPAARALPPTDQARRMGLEGTQGLALLLASLILSHPPKEHTGTRLGWNNNLVAHVRAAMVLYPSASIKGLSSSSHQGVSSFPYCLNPGWPCYRGPQNVAEVMAWLVEARASRGLAPLYHVSRDLTDAIGVHLGWHAGGGDTWTNGPCFPGDSQLTARCE